MSHTKLSFKLSFLPLFVVRDLYDERIILVLDLG